jgi:hypothetical protein
MPAITPIPSVSPNVLQFALIALNTCSNENTIHTDFLLSSHLAYIFLKWHNSNNDFSE